VKLFVKLVMSLVGAAGGLAFGITILQEMMTNTDDARISTVVTTVIGWFVGLYAGRLICHDPPSK
jgi:hypothetical protein